MWRFIDPSERWDARLERPLRSKRSTRLTVIELVGRGRTRRSGKHWLTAA
jgi:hypothetical protein